MPDQGAVRGNDQVRRRQNGLQVPVLKKGPGLKACMMVSGFGAHEFPVLKNGL